MQGNPGNDPFERLNAAANSAVDDAANAVLQAQRAAERAEAQNVTSGALHMLQMLGNLALADSDLGAKLRDQSSRESRDFQTLVTWVLDAASAQATKTTPEVPFSPIELPTSTPEMQSAKRSPFENTYVVRLTDGTEFPIGSERATLADDMAFILSAYVAAEIPPTNAELLNTGFRAGEDLSEVDRKLLLSAARDRLNTVFQAAFGEDAFQLARIPGMRGARMVLNDRLRAANVRLNLSGQETSPEGENSKKK